MPGAEGFTTPTDWRLNPSYMPLQLMQWFAGRSNDARWKALLASSRRIITASSPNGFAPDWIVYDRDKGFQLDAPGSGNGEGSYNAIRVYLWAGMLADGSPDQRLLIDRLKPMAQFIDSNGYPPESVDVRSGTAGRAGSSGFSAAVLPFLSAAGFDNAYRKQLQRIERTPLKRDAYYEQVLSLFALGWVEKLYRFDASGNLRPQWSACQ
jgi:endoglucanase